MALAETTVYVDVANGNDSNPGTAASPVQTAGRGLAIARKAASFPVAIAFASGIYRLAETLTLGPDDSGISFIAIPGQVPVFSGSRQLIPSTWEPFNVRPAGPSETLVFNGTNAVYGATPSPVGPVYNWTRTPDAAACQAVCAEFGTLRPGETCTAFTWHDTTWPIEYNSTCWIRNDGVWTPVTDAHHVAGHVINATSSNVWRTTVSLGPAFEGLLNATQRVKALVINGTKRAIRARYPNADPETTKFPLGWIPRSGAWSWHAEPIDMNTTVETFNMSAYDGYPTGMFADYFMGYGGPCARYDNNKSYWCQPNGRVNGQTYFVHTPSSLSFTDNVLPNAPWSNGTQDGIVNWWRGGHWFTLMSGMDYDPTGPNGNDTIALVGGANQGAEGDASPAEFFVEQVLDELDSDLEFFLEIAPDGASATLFYQPDGMPAGLPPPAGTTFEAPTLSRLVHLQGTPASAIRSTIISGITFENTAPTYLGDGWASCTGGDWAIAQDGVLLMEYSENASITQTSFNRVDGNGIFLLGYNRNANISDSSFHSLGGSAVTLFGRSNGYDASNGDQPRGTSVERMWCAYVGLYEKQSSCYYQGLAPLNSLTDSIMYQSSRALVNFEDYIGGGSLMDHNLLFQSCTESQDHSAFNSWHRVPMLTRLGSPDGSLTARPLYTNITRNFIVATEGGSYGPEAGANGGCFDLDDGSSWADVRDNWCSYGGYKTDFNGHSHLATGNLNAYAYVYGSRCLTVSSLPVASEGGVFDSSYSGITCVLANAGDAYLDIGGSCDPTQPDSFTLHLGNNSIYAPNKDATVNCGGKTYSITEWLATGIDPGTTILDAPTPDQVVAWGRAMFNITGSLAQA